MNLPLWPARRKRVVITLAICTILVISSVMLLQMNKTTEAALVNSHPGLVGWWRFDEGAGTIAEDSSGYGNDGIVYADTNIAENDQVWICDVNNKKPLAVGIAIISGDQMVAENSGKAIITIHHVGDMLWSFGVKSL